MLPARRIQRMSLFRRCPTCRAFTLVEVLSAIAIVAVLFTISVGIVRGAKQRAAVARAKSELSLLATALEDFKRHYGDYPQTGPSAANSQRIAGTSGPGLGTAQATLFNALTGAYGPTGPAGGRINGPVLTEISRFAVEVPIVAATFAVPTGSPPAKPTVNNAFLDPWGNRYLYFYKRPAGGAAWAAPGFLLYSAGPDGAASALPAATGIFVGATRLAGDNADNLYSDQLP